MQMKSLKTAKALRFDLWNTKPQLNHLDITTSIQRINTTHQYNASLQRITTTNDSQ